MKNCDYFLKLNRRISKNIIFDITELRKFDYLTELKEIYKKDNSFTEFVCKLKEFSFDFYVLFKNSEKIKKLYNDNKEFMIIVKELSLDLYKLYNEIDNILKVFIVWNNFFNIYVCIKDNCYQKENIIQLVNEQTFNWLVSYQENTVLLTSRHMNTCSEII